MIVGRFGDTTGRPYVEAIVWFVRLKIRMNVSFLVDTGADISIINPIDGVQAKLPYNKLTNVDDVSGIGGARKIFLEPAVIVFADHPATLHRYKLDIGILELDDSNGEQYAGDDIRSLLGRDIIDNWRMNYDPCDGTLEFDVVRAGSSHQVDRGKIQLRPAPGAA